MIFSNYIIFSSICFITLFEQSYCNLFKYGCNFTDENYLLPERSYSPSWGFKSEAISFRDDNHFKSFFKKLNQTYQEVIIKYNYNTIDGFLGFYNDYLKNAALTKSSSFFKFFLNYKIPYRPHENCVSLSITVLDEMAKFESEFPGVGNKGYLASGHSDIDQLKYLEYKIRKKDIDGNAKTHALGAYKINVAGRIGYVIFDTGNALSTPMVVMVNANDPLNKLTAYYGNRIAVYEKFDENADYILVKNYYKLENKFFGYSLIYTAVRYCSFSETSTKKAYLDPFKSIVKRSHGTNIAAIYTFLRLPTAKPNTIVIYYTNSTTQENIRVELYYQNWSNTFLKENRYEDIDKLRHVNNVLGFKDGYLDEVVEKLNTIQRDKTFIDRMQILYSNVMQSKHSTRAMLSYMGEKITKLVTCNKNEARRINEEQDEEF